MTDAAAAASVEIAVVVPYTGANDAPSVSVVRLTVLSEAVLLRATRYSTFSSRSTREKA